MRLLVILLFLQFSSAYSQNNCRDIHLIVKDIANGGYVKNSKLVTGIGMRTSADSQYVRYEELLRCASAQQLKKLLDHDSTAVAVFAWVAYLQGQPSEGLQFLMTDKEQLKKRTVTVFLNGCQGYVRRSMLDYMIDQLYDQLLQKEISLSASEIVDFLNFKESRTREKWRENASGSDGRF